MLEKKVKCPIRGRKCMGARCAWLATVTLRGERVPMCGVMLQLANVKGLRIEYPMPCGDSEVGR